MCLVVYIVMLFYFMCVEQNTMNSFLFVLHINNSFFLIDNNIFEWKIFLARFPEKKMRRILDGYIGSVLSKRRHIFLFRWRHRWLI